MDHIRARSAIYSCAPGLGQASAAAGNGNKWGLKLTLRLCVLDPDHNEVKTGAGAAMELLGSEWAVKFTVSTLGREKRFTSGEGSISSSKNGLNVDLAREVALP